MQKLADEIIALIQLHLTLGLGDRTLCALLNHSQDLAQIAEEVKRGTYFGIRKGKPLPLADRMQAETQYERFIKSGEVKLIPIYSEDYPKALRALYDPPPLLYVRGQLPSVNKRVIAVVGTRRSSNYGKQVTEELVSGLTGTNAVILSGMAIGIDALAHRQAIASDLETVAVLGSGVDVVAPVQNQSLYDQIVTKGAVISEFALGTTPTVYTFPQRNRIIAALAELVVVVEADLDSGALITAQHALDVGKEVWAVPGPINSIVSRGTNQLISNGARILLSIEEFISEIFSGAGVASAMLAVTLTDPFEAKVYDLISKQPKFIDDILAEIEAETAQVLTVLATLEVRGLIDRLNGDFFVRKTNGRL